MPRDRARQISITGPPQILTTSTPQHPAAPLPRCQVSILFSDTSHTLTAHIPSRTFSLSATPLIAAPVLLLSARSLSSTCLGSTTLSTPQAAPAALRHSQDVILRPTLSFTAQSNLMPDTGDVVAGAGKLEGLGIHADVMEDSSPALYWDLCYHQDGLLHLNAHTFIIQDWDEKSTGLKPATYFHLRFLPVDHQLTAFTCDCKQGPSCEHIQLLLAHVTDVLAMDALSTLNPLAFLVAATKTYESYVFSVSASSHSIAGGGKRTMVFLNHDGTWHCRSDGRSGQCHHVGYARSYAGDAGIVNDSGRLVDAELQVYATESGSNSSSVPSVVRQPVSFKPVPVPRWCRIPSDVLEYNPIPDPECPPETLRLGSSARCCCGSTSPDGEHATMLHPFTIFGLWRALLHTIEVLRCTSCKHWHCNYGPDCGEHGVFNWNNVYGFTHKLLNQYTNVFTSAENLLSLFVTTVHRLYESSYSQTPFCSTETFTKVWFAFTDLQALNSGMDLLCLSAGTLKVIIPGTISQVIMSGTL